MLLRPKIWFWFSWVTIIGSIIIIAVQPPQLGIDFIGGSLVELAGDNINTVEITDALQANADIVAIVQPTQENSVIIRSTPLDPDQHQRLLEATIGAGLATEELRFESVGPTVGKELRRKALIAIGIALVTMVFYLSYIFRHTSNRISPWKFGIATAIALAHDLLVVTALFSILGKFTSVSIDTLFLTAMLAILGYSVNDTVVIFNRLREEWLATRTGTLLEVMDTAAKATLTRSLNTSFTSLIVLVALLIFGGSSIQWFILALIAGTIVGAYSSFFVAPPILYYLAKK